MKTETPAAGEAAGAETVVQGEQKTIAPPGSFQSPPTMLDWALSYARNNGCYVLPVHWMENGHCSCGKEDCNSPAKHPLTKHGEKDATIDPAKIEAWWRQWPCAGIAIATGPSRLVVVDVDGQKGLTLFRKVSCGDRPRTLMAKTGREGGFHVFYRGTGIPSSSMKGEHLDVRGSTGYVVVAPSGHASGAVYAWANANQPIAPVPAWVGPWVASRSGGKAHAPIACAVELPAHIQRSESLTTKLDDALTAVPYSPYEAARLWSALAAIPPDIDGRTWFSIGALCMISNGTCPAKISDSSFGTNGRAGARGRGPAMANIVGAQTWKSAGEASHETTRANAPR
jgi:putative DNA primase/helicase